MNTLGKIYWLRLGLGVIAAIVCTSYNVATNTITNAGPFRSLDLFNGATIALLIYMLSYYAIKSVFFAKVEKPRKLMTVGIGIYFLSWLVFWVLFYTILAGQAPT